MVELSHIYIHRNSIGNVGISASVQASMYPILEAMYNAQTLLGYRLHLLEDRESAENELLHHMFDFESVTQSRYPFVYASMTPLDNESSGASIDSFMSEHGFERFR